jgi:GntR family transcriptional regulator of gluconate operon
MTDRDRKVDYSHLSGFDLKAPTLADAVADQLRSAILAGQFAPGERLYEAALAREFGISRGPIREALALLEGDGIVENEPRKGKFVRPLDSRVIDEIYSLRRVLEPYAAELIMDSLTEQKHQALNEAVEAIEQASKTADVAAIARSDLAFHRKLYELTEHRPLQRIWEDTISGLLQMLVSITTSTHVPSDPVRNHEEIVSCIASGDHLKTHDVLIEHIEDGWKRASAAVQVLNADT